MDTDGAKKAFLEVLKGRYELMLDEPYDAVQAALGAGDLSNPRLVRFRSQAANLLKQKKAMVTTFTRPVNIAKAAEQKGQMPEAFDFSRLDSDEGQQLLTVVHQVQATLDQAVGHDVPQSIEALEAMVPPTNLFFDRTMVMAEDKTVMGSRLSLVATVRNQILRVADITKLVFEGEES